MEINEENKFKRWFKRFGVASLACVLCIAVALSIAFSVANQGKEVGGPVMDFALPMKNANVEKDYAEDRLQKNENLKRYEIHLSVDLSSADPSVFAIYDGVVIFEDFNDIEGGIVKIQHEGGYVSVYSSLSKEIKVKKDEKVTKGQLLGYASNMALNEKKGKEHLHFTLYKDGNPVDPNNYLDLQNK